MKVILTLINSSLILSSILAVPNKYVITHFPQLDTLYFGLWQTNQIISVHESESDSCYDVFNSKIFLFSGDENIKSVIADISEIDKNFINTQITYENKRIKLKNGQILGEQVLLCYLSENIKLYISNFWNDRLFAFYEKPCTSNVLTILGLVEQFQSYVMTILYVNWKGTTMSNITILLSTFEAPILKHYNTSSNSVFTT